MASPFWLRGEAQEIRWRAYSAEALAEPREKLLVIGTSGAHACQLLDDESLADPQVARAIERRFCALRVDAEARPDVDARHRPPEAPAEAWPLVCVLGPAGELLAAHTHLSRHAFERLVRGPAPREPASREPRESPPPATRGEGGAGALGDALLAQLRASFHPAHGGFGPAPKAPHAPALDWLLALPARDARLMALRTLEAIAQGGLRDHLAGGFHRDSTDEKWLVPHFEKRACDQAALLGTLTRAARLPGAAPSLAEAARELIAYVTTRLALPDGGFAAGEAADIGPYDDGSHYTWTLEEAARALAPDELAVAQRRFDIYGRGELHTDPTRNVLFVAASIDELARELASPPAEIERLLERARRTLLGARAARPRPPIDASLYVGPSAHLARALILAGEPARAARTVERLTAEALLADGSVRHVLGATGGAGDARDPGLARLRWLDDAAQLGLLALAALEAGLPGPHLDVACRIADRLLAAHAEPDGGFCDLPRDTAGPGLLARPRVPVTDGPADSGNALAGQLLLGLARAGRPHYAEAARRLVPGQGEAALLDTARARGIRGCGMFRLAQTVGDLQC